MKNALVKIRLLFLVAVIAGCGEVPKAELHNSPDPADTGAPSQDIEEDPDARGLPQAGVQLIPQDAPDSYHVKVVWEPGEWAPEQWWVHRQDASLTTEILAQLSVEKKEFTDTAVQAGASYLYQLIAVVEGTPTSVAQVRADVPRDWVLLAGSVNDWSTPPKEQRKFGRLFFQKGAVLRTGSADFSIELLGLFSQGATIETFVRQGEATAGQPGRKGGDIRISAEKAQGHLAIVSRGETGGRGADGKAGGAGTKGADGTGPVYEWDQVREFVSQRLDPMRSLDRDPARFQKLVRAAVKGGDGQSGNPGEKGGQGLPGGDSGDVWIEAQNATGFLPEVHSEPGVGGAGGTGGVGGPGGEGGLAAVSTPGGRPGAAGPRGAAGATGADGKAGKVTVKIGGKTVLEK